MRWYNSHTKNRDIKFKIKYHRRYVYRFDVPTKLPFQLFVSKYLGFLYQVSFLVSLLLILSITGNHEIRALPEPNITYSASGVLGQANFSTNTLNGEGSFVGLYGPKASIIDPLTHQLFVSDTNNNRILVYDLDVNDNSTGQNPVYVLGQPDFASNSGCYDTTSASTLCSPSGLTYDSTNNKLYVSDTSNNRILVYDLSDGISNGMAASSVLGQPDFVSNGCDTTSASTLCIPSGLTYDSTNNKLYVSDISNNRILVYDLSDGISNGMAASSVLGQPDFVSGYCNGLGISVSTLCNPSGLTYDSTNNKLYVSDTDNDRILVYDLSDGISNGMAASSVLGQPDFVSGYCNGLGISASTLCIPSGLTYDSTNNKLYVSDTNNSRILVYDLSDGISNGMAASSVLGQLDFASNGCNSLGISVSTLCNPSGLTYDSTNNKLYVSDPINNNRILVYDLSDGISNGMAASSVLGQPDFVSGGTGLYQLNSQGLSNPSDSVIDPTTHKLFVDDSSNNRILIYNLNSNNQLINQSPAFVLGQINFTNNYCDGPNNTSDSTTLCSPANLAYNNSSQQLFVSDTYNDRILVYDLSDGISNGMAASSVLGQPDFVSGGCYNLDSIISASTLCSPSGLTYDSTNNKLYVSDTSNNRILVYDLSDGISNGMAASSVLGQPDFVSNGYDTTDSTLRYPLGLTYDSTNNKLYVSDNSNSRILVYDLSDGISNGMAASSVLGQPDFVSGGCNDLGISASTLCYPWGLTYDSTNNKLYVSDTSNNRILVYDLSDGISNGMAASSVLGQPDFVSNDYGDQGIISNANTLFYPDNSTYDSVDNTLYVVDSGDNRILIYNFVHITTNAISNAQDGVHYSQTITESGSQGIVTFSLQSGNLPSGITLNTSNGILSGIPSKVGNYSFKIGVTDDDGVDGINTDSHSYSLTVSRASVPVSVIQSGTINQSITTPITKSTANSNSTAIQAPVPFYNITNLATFNAGNSYEASDLEINSVITYNLSISNNSNSPTGENNSIEKHTITINSIDLSNPNDPSVTLTLRSTPITATVHLGQKISEDVNGDGVPDVGLEAIAISDNGINLKIWKITHVQTSTIIVKTNSSNKFVNLVRYSIFILIILLVAIITKVRIRKHLNQSISERDRGIDTLTQ
jgi:DNA-binding beta-propeller fold protein YncE